MPGCTGKKRELHIRTSKSALPVLHRTGRFYACYMLKVNIIKIHLNIPEAEKILARKYSTPPIMQINTTGKNHPGSVRTKAP